MSKQRKSYLLIFIVCLAVSAVLVFAGLSSAESYHRSCEGQAYGALADARAEGEARDNLR